MDHFSFSRNVSLAYTHRISRISQNSKLINEPLKRFLQNFPVVFFGRWSENVLMDDAKAASPSIFLPVVITRNAASLYSLILWRLGLTVLSFRDKIFGQKNNLIENVFHPLNNRILLVRRIHPLSIPLFYQSMPSQQ